MPHTVTAATPDPPAQLNLAMAEAATFNAEFTWLNNGIAQSLTGYSAMLSVGRRADSSPILTVTSQAGEIILQPGGRAGVVSVSIPAAKTALLTGFKARTGVYDLVVVAPDGSTTRLAEGTVTVDAAVTPFGGVSNPPLDPSAVVLVYGTPQPGAVPVWNSVRQRLEYDSPSGFPPLAPVTPNDGDTLVYDAGSGLWTPSAASGGSVADTKSIEFPFTFDMPGLVDGVAVYTPAAGESLRDAWIEVTEAWAGDPAAAADIGIAFFNNQGILGNNAASAWSLVQADRTREGLRTNSNLLSLVQLSATGIGSRFAPATFVNTDPVKLVVSQYGTPTAGGGVASTATAGAAILRLIIGLAD